MPRLAAAALLVALLACASARETTSRATVAGNEAALAKTAPGTRVVCQDERPTGSNIPVRTCYRVRDDLERDHARDATLDQLNAPRVQMRGTN